MLLAIDIGNTQAVFGVEYNGEWQVWRSQTNPSVTEDELAAWLGSMFNLSQIPMAVTSVMCASVVPQMNDTITRLGRKWLRTDPEFLTADKDWGIPVVYEPRNAVGADRLANALAALSKYKPPIIVVDFGTATTFDAIDRTGAYVGGAIMPGIEVSAKALVGRTAKLPQVELHAPELAIGRTTAQSLQSGLVLGYAAAIDGLASRISAELGGGVTILATGGLSGSFMGICTMLRHHEPELTLHGLKLAWQSLGKR